MVQTIMKCWDCGTVIDVTCNHIPPTWFGVYQGYKMLGVICADCNCKPENKDWWKNFKEIK